MMKTTERKYLIASLMLIISHQSAFSEEKTVSKLPTKVKSAHAQINPQSVPALAETQSKYRNVKTLTAEFTQKKTNLALGNTKESLGRIFIKRPNMFRWQTEEPEASILVSNGKKIWYYTPPFRDGEKGQVMVRHATDQSKMAVDLLSGRFDMKKDFKTKQLNPDHFELIPVKSAGDVERVELFVEKPTKLVYKCVLFTTTGNQTELTLKNVTLDPPLSDSMFQFVPPPNTEEIR